MKIKLFLFVVVLSACSKSEVKPGNPLIGKWSQSMPSTDPQYNGQSIQLNGSVWEFTADMKYHNLTYNMNGTYTFTAKDATVMIIVPGSAANPAKCYQSGGNLFIKFFSVDLAKPLYVGTGDELVKFTPM